MKKIYCYMCGKYRKCKKPKMSYIFKKKKHQFFVLFAVSTRMKMKKYLEKKNPLRY